MTRLGRSKRKKKQRGSSGPISCVIVGCLSVAMARVVIVCPIAMKSGTLQLGISLLLAS